MHSSYSLCLCALAVSVCASPVLADTVRVAATGDSQTNGYAPRLSAALDQIGTGNSVTKIASGGATAAVYTGQTVDLNASPPQAHNFAQEALASDPDVIVFMLGTNDALRDGVDAYKTSIAQVFDEFSAARNSRGRRPAVVIATEVPILDKPDDARYAAAEALMVNDLNPWLRSEALKHGFTFLNLHRLIQREPDWQSWYSDDAVNPGYVHLWATVDGQRPGYTWMANTIALGINRALAEAAAVPEPSTAALALIAAGLAVVARRRSR